MNINQQKGKTMNDIGLTLGICLTGCVILKVIENITNVHISTAIYLVWGIAAGCLSVAIKNRK